MRTTGNANHTAILAAVGLDAKTMGQIREAVSTEAVIPSVVWGFEEALGAIRNASPDVVLYSFDQDYEEAVRVAAKVASDHPGITQVAIASREEPERMRAAMRAGFREYIVLPDDAERLRQSVRSAYGGGATREDAGQLVSLWGAKGGVGTTLLSVNLAAELSPVHRVCLMDLDFASGDISAFLDLTPERSIHDLLAQIQRADERMLSGVVAHHPSKIHILTQPQDLNQRAEAHGDAIMRILTLTSNSYQYCIADCGSSLEEASLTTVMASDHILLLSTPDVPSVKNAWRRLQLLEQMNVEKERIHLVINRWDRKNPSLSQADIETNLGQKIDVFIQEDKSVVRAINDGRLLRDVDRKAPIIRDIESLVGVVTGEEVVKERPSAGLMSWLFRS